MNLLQLLNNLLDPQVFHSISQAKNKFCLTIFHDAAESVTAVWLVSTVSDQVWRLHVLVRTGFGYLLLDLSAPSAGLV